MRQTNAATRENSTLRRRRAGRARAVSTSLLSLALLAAAAWAASTRLYVSHASASNTSRVPLDAPPFAFGNTTVMNTNDNGPGSLRQAVADVAPGGTITFDVTGTIALTGGELTIDKDLTINGPGANQLTVSGNNLSRVFNINGGSVDISGLTISNGQTTFTSMP